MIENLIELDREIFIYLNSLGKREYDFFWLVMTNKILNFTIYVIFSIIYLSKTNLKRFSLLLFTILLMILFTDQTTNFFKYSFSRLRPCHEEDLIGIIRLLKSNCGGLYGYFSAHASNSFALASFFSMLYRKNGIKIPIFLISVAVLVSYSRIYIGVHYPFDVISGAFFGILSGYSFYLFSKKYFKVF